MTEAPHNPSPSLPLGQLDFYRSDARPAAKGDPRRRIRRPAISLLVVTAVSAFLILLGVAGAVWSWVAYGDFEAGMLAIALGFVVMLHGLAIWGLVSALTLRNYTSAWIGVGLSVVPCANALSILWLPLLLSAWAVFSLLDPDTRNAFRK